MRPSCGWRFSAMSRRAMILMRDTITPCTTCGGSSTSRSIPSLRKRTTERRSKASMWMSEAPSRTACENSALINRTIGASSSLSSRSATFGRLEDMSMALLGRRGRGARVGLAWDRLRRIGCSRRGHARSCRRRGRRPRGILLGCLRRRRGGRPRLRGFHAVVYVLALGTLAARVAAQIFITVLRHAITVLDRADDHRPKEDHQVGPLALLALEAEQRAQKRNVAEQRNLLRGHAQGVLDQPAEHDGIAVVHHDLGFERALGGDQIARAGARSRDDVRDLLIDLEPDGRALGNLRLDAQGEADVSALDRLEGIHRPHPSSGGSRRRRATAGYKGHVLPDDDFRLVVVQRKEVRRGGNVAQLV